MRAVKAGVALVGAVALLLGLYWFWYHHRGPPEPITEMVGVDLEYTREIRQGAVWHWLKVPLQSQIWVTPPDAEKSPRLRARYTSQVLAENGLDWAINASFFFPFHSNGIFDYYPHEGDPVDALGLTISGRQSYGVEDGSHQTFWATNRGVGIGAPPAELEYAVSGYQILERGRTVAWAPALLAERSEPRLALGLGEGHLWIVAVDGRQPSYSGGCNVETLARALLARGVTDALHLDGGGSTTLVVKGPNGPRVLNVPVHGRHPPGVERPVANHLGGRLPKP